MGIEPRKRSPVKKAAGSSRGGQIKKKLREKNELAFEIQGDNPNK